MKKLLLILLLLPIGSMSQEVKLVVPNIFTPNGDGVNDNFKVDTDYEMISCTIFNRWGEVIYKYYGRNGTWDGRNHSGVAVPEGVYFATVEASNSDGSTETVQVAVTLVR